MPETLVEKIAAIRRADTREEATSESKAAKFSERRRREIVRERNRALWIDFYMAQAEVFALRSAEYQRRARALEQGLIERPANA